MIDLDLITYRSLVDALDYFARHMDAGERSENMKNGVPSPGQAIISDPCSPPQVSRASSPSCRTGVSFGVSFSSGCLFVPSPPDRRHFSGSACGVGSALTDKRLCRVIPVFDLALCPSHFEVPRFP